MNYKELSDNSRAWIYQSDREFTEEEIEIIKAKGNEFLNSWNSHGTALHAAFEIFYKRFIVIFTDENHASASGCSIDKSAHFVKQLEKDFAISLFDRTSIAYKENGKIVSFEFNKFDTLFSEGKIDGTTIVFNNLVSTKKEFETQWEVPLKESWLWKLIKTENRLA